MREDGSVGLNCWFRRSRKTQLPHDVKEQLRIRLKSHSSPFVSLHIFKKMHSHISSVNFCSCLTPRLNNYGIVCHICVVCVCVCALVCSCDPLCAIPLRGHTHKHTHALTHTQQDTSFPFCVFMCAPGNTENTGDSAHALGPRHAVLHLSFSVWGLQPSCKYLFLTRIIQRVCGQLYFTQIL